MKISYSAMSFLCFMAASPLTFAKDIQGMTFSHQDWEVSCSNTGTCRAAGYQDDRSENMPASILLTRKAGAKQPIQLQFALANGERTLDKTKLNNIHLYINAEDLGALTVDGSELPLMGTLSQPQVKGLLQHAAKNVNIVFKNTDYSWTISDQGMTATLLKMDDFQQRVGTLGAVVKKGALSEANVLMPQPKLRVKKVNTAMRPYRTLRPQTQQYLALHKVLMAAHAKNQATEGFCEGIYGENGVQPQKIELYKLSNQKVLATTLCWRGAYNEGYGAWVIDQSLQGKAHLVTESASDFAVGEISSAQKGRGIGDCWALNEWIWNGKSFIQTLNRSTGLCKGVAAGGVWNLDLIEAVAKSD